MRRFIFAILSGFLCCSPAVAGDAFLDAMDLARAGHIKEAKPLMHKLAEEGDCDAQSQLAAMWIFGEGGQKNFKEGFVWLAKAAEQGEPLSQMTMGDLYFNKSNVTNLSCRVGSCPDEAPQRDIGVAYKWYLLAEKRVIDGKDETYVATILGVIRSEMTQTEKSIGEKLAVEWQPTPRLCELRHYY